MAVAPGRHAHGVASSADDWRAPRGSAANGREFRDAQDRVTSVGVASEYVVTHVERALGDTYRTDAHLVTYVLRDADGTPLPVQPRVNKSALPWVLSLGYRVGVEVLFADVDNPGHGAWTPELEAIALAQDAQLATAGVYYTAHGRRIVQPLSRPVDVVEAEAVIGGWLGQLEQLGMVVDDSCVDWTRHFRLPHVRRSGRPYRSPRVDLSRMRPIAPPAPAARGKWARATHRHVGAMADHGATPLAQAFAAAGWVLAPLGRDKVAVRCPWADTHTTRASSSTDTSTVLFGSSALYPLGYFHCSHAHCSHRSQLDVVAALPAAARALLPRPEAPRPITRNVVDHATARTTLEEAFRTAPDGLSVVVAGCGTGKTEAALVVARERAARTHATPGEHTRAPAHSRTALSVPTTRLAGELVARLASQGVQARRYFGPLSVRRADGEPECRYHAAASAYASGGQSIPWDFCRGRDRSPCEFADECTAFDGAEGPTDARIVVGPHALLGQLAGAMGTTGLLVIDEPPPLLSHEVLTAEELRETEGRLSPFADRYAAALRVSLRAIAAWIAEGPLDEPGPLSRGVQKLDEALLEAAFDATGETDAVLAAKAAYDLDHDGPKVPPVRREYAAASRRAASLAAQVGRASRVLQLVWLGLTCDPGGVVVRIEERRQKGLPEPLRVLVVTLPDVQLREALRRPGSTVVADANGRLHLPVLERVGGYEPHLVEAYAADGAPVTRTLQRTRATRAAWMPSGRLEVSRGLLGAVRSAVDWLLEVPAARVAIVTILALELALRGALGEDVATAWRDAGQTPGTLPELVQALGPELRRLPSTPDLGHYGAIRGLDHWREHDALVTLGDPWLQLADVGWESQFLGLADWEGRYEALCAAELEQAHGRLRTVHRTRPARALHVGHVMPSGWLDVDVREDRGGRPRQEAALTVDVLRSAIDAIGGAREAARHLGCDVRTLQRYATGERGCPPDVASTLLRLAETQRGRDRSVQSCDRNPLIRDLLSRGFGRSESFQGVTR